ncbi:hypothetical protein [Hydrogenophaga sp.]|uniref:hypothetical protein n=1 Tax=Hydrogenophaga sp. TaxID=1904254 RepID=UPI002717180A|nr:hypothetical protein [Hydrogenophaga sp.]MDO9136008.1 hypothetical protein [Hydrogenophaga sp.]
MRFKLSLIAAGALAAASVVTTTAQAAPAFADVIVMMDESGSMAGEQVWIASQIPTLNAGLVAEGVGVGGTNKFGLIGFGYSAAGAPNDLRGFDVATGGGATNNSPGTFGTAANFSASAGNLIASGGFEDGYAAINLANSLAGRVGAARNYILVTDEDRDVGAGVPGYEGILASMTRTNTLLNAVVNSSFFCDNTSALGVARGPGSSLVSFVADGLGGFSKCTGTTTLGTGFGSTVADYVNLALDTGGAAWNLNFLRSGGLLADSFTAAFIDVKIEEITTQPEPVSLPGTLALLGVGLAGLGAVRRKQANAV